MQQMRIPPWQRWSDTEWKAWGIEEPSHRFFVLLWSEITDHSTADTWQARTSNFRSVLHEILRAIESSEEFKGAKDYIPSLVDEARRMLDLDPVLTSRFPFVKDYLPAGPFNFGEKNFDAGDFRRQFTILQGNLRGYFAALMEALRAVLAERPKDNFEDRIYNLVLSVATAVGIRGYSLPYIRNAIFTLLDPATPDFLDRFARFEDGFGGKEQEFECIFGVTWPRNFEIKAALIPSMEILKGPPKELKTEASQEFFNQAGADDVFLGFKVDAVDYVAARDRAEERLAQTLSVFNLFEFQNPFTVKGQKALLRTTQDERIVQREISRRKYVRGSPFSAKYAERCLGVLEQLGRQDADQLTSAMEYHRIALSAETDEAHIVNLWIALECLIKREKSDTSIIDAVVRSIAPTVALANFDKLVHHTSVNISRFWSDKIPKEVIKELFPNSTRNRVESRDTLSLLMANEDSALYKKFLEIMSNPLLRYRVARLRARTFGNHLVALRSLEGHKRNVEWQLKRIYRARNFVMHQGRGLEGLAHLGQHLHTYFIVTIHHLIHDLRSNKSWSIADTFSHRARLLQHVGTAIKASPERIFAQALLTPSLFLKTGDLVPWPFPDTSTPAAPAAKPGVK